MTDTDTPTGGAKGNTTLDAIFERTEQKFRERRQILSFQEFFELFQAQPRRYGRNIAQYLRDCFDHFGITERPAPWGTQRRFNLFDCPWDGGEQRLIGQENTQRAVYRLLTNFVQEGRIQRIILLHGPNGSAKSSLINCIMRALEVYSRTDEGALYTFNWVFPTEKISRGSIGFGGSDVTIGGQPRSALTTYAYLDDLSVDAKIASAMRDHPLLLIPLTERERLLKATYGDDVIVPDYLRKGDLDHISKRIFEALLASYQGDMSQVLRHIQVERFFISRRYRVGAVTIEPQMRIDAGSRQITVDRSLQSLPASLQNQTLFEVFGPLVEGNRGVVEYNDVLKRQPELNKYLLATGEKATASLDHANIFLDALLIGSANELYLDAFKKAPDYPSFKARLELVRMPYLLDYMVEAHIYDEQISTTEIGKPILPHTAHVAALWAVLTRLTRPQPDEGEFSDDLKKVIEELTPIQKADLYATGQTPDHLSAELGRELASAIPELMNQSSDTSDYEGRYGASPREMKLLILNAAQNGEYPHLSPLALFDELRQLVRDPSVYPFLQLKPEGPYHRFEEFIETVTERYLDILDHEVRVAMGLVEESAYDTLFKRYIDHVTHAVRGEKIHNRTTSQYEEPDEDLMEQVERQLSITEDAEEFRRSIMSTIAAWSIDNPGQTISYAVIFPKYLAALRNAYFEEHQEQIRKLQQALLVYIDDDGVGGLSRAEQEQAEQTLVNLREEFGYTREGAREVVVFLMQRRYIS
ncbi:MAG: serine protein kinase [Myxococcales bacterium]|nr:serine protein kinase [Myxococcales bacterium]